MIVANVPSVVSAESDIDAGGSASPEVAHQVDERFASVFNVPIEVFAGVEDRLVSPEILLDTDCDEGASVGEAFEGPLIDISS